MKIFAAFFAFTAALAAQTTTVTGTIKDGANQGVTGSCTYRLASGRALGASGVELVGEPVTVRFTNGVFSAPILPTDTASPTTQYYTVSCSGSRGWSKTGTWIVPTSGSSVALDTVWVNQPPSPPITFLPSQLNTAGLTVGVQYCIVPGSNGAASLVACTGGGGGGNLSWNTLTDLQWTSLTNLQWTSITN